MIDLHRLRSLRALATHGTISAAADALHLTPSAVSQQLAKLEQEVGQPLLEANGRGVRLTDAAQLLVVRAEEILSLVERTTADLEAKRGAIVGPLAIGAFATAARAFAPRVLAELCQQHADLDIELSEVEPVEAVQRVVRGDLDVALVDDWANAPVGVPDRLERCSLFDDVADLALPTEHPLADRTELDLVALDGAAWISWPRGSICHDWLVHTLRSGGADPHIVHTAMEHATQLALVAAGLGVAIIPRLGRDPVPDGVRFVPVRPALVRTIHAVWREDASRRPAIAAALASFERHAPRFAQEPRPVLAAR